MEWKRRSARGEAQGVTNRRPTGRAADSSGDVKDVAGRSQDGGISHEEKAAEECERWDGLS